MRVLHVIPSISFLHGGPSVTIRSMAGELARNGIEVHVCTTNDDGSGKLAVPLGTPVMDKGVTYWYFQRQGRFYTFSWPLTRWLIKHVRDYDVLHIHALFSYAAIPAAISACRSNVPYVVRPLGVLNSWGMISRHPLLKKLSFPIIEQPILQRASAVHFTSEQERTEAERLGVWPKGVVIPNAVDVPRGRNGKGFRKRYPEFANRLIVLFLSRLDRIKGLDLLFSAFSRLRFHSPRPLLVVAGDGDQIFVDELHNQATRLGIDGDVVWPGFVGEDEKWGLFADADVFVLPSYSENFGMAVVEAMAAGLPVVISNQVGVHQEVLDAGAGIVVPCHAEGVAKAMCSLLRDSENRLTMGMNGKKLASSKFTGEAVSSTLIELYQKVVACVSEKKGLNAEGNRYT